MSASSEPKRAGKRRSKVNEQKQAPRDVTGKWRIKVHELADRLGWQRSALWSLFDECACLTEYELRIGRPIAESAGYRLLRGLVDKTELATEVQ